MICFQGWRLNPEGQAWLLTCPGLVGLSTGSWAVVCSPRGCSEQEKATDGSWGSRCYLMCLLVSMIDPAGSDGRESACHAGDLGSILGLGKSPEEGNGYPLQYSWASQVGASGKEPTCKCRRHKRCRFNRWVLKIPLVEGTATHSSILAGRFPWTEEPSWLQSAGLQRVGCDWSDLAHDWPSAAEKWWLEWTLSSIARDTGARHLVGGGTQARGWDGWVPRGGSERALQMHPFSQSPSSVIKSEKNIGRANWGPGRLQ